MRTTIDLPADLHAVARQIAHDENRSMSSVIEDLIRQSLHRDVPAMSTTTRGMPQVSVGRPITAEDVRSLDDEE
ncbi:MAG: antitoxin [Acidimicrobiales bacterium]|nr:MAG: antitoxin [Acidimicrobiales bacterium]